MWLILNCGNPVTQHTVLCASCHATVPDEPYCGQCDQTVLLHGKYTLLKKIGAGSFGTTYLARHTPDGILVAIKEMFIRNADSLKVIELFEREARILEDLNHAGIPRYFEDFIHEDGRNTAFYLVQEFIDGEPLSAQQRLRTLEDVLKICLQVLDILIYLHGFSPPVIHRDIKPANIMRRPDGTVVLIDFGSVRAALDTTGGSTVAGTFGYMAPEQFMGRALPQTDVYAVAATAIALLSGRDPQELLTEDRVLDLSPLNLSPQALNLFQTMLANRPENRPTAAEAIERISAVLRGDAMVTRPSSDVASFPDFVNLPAPRPLPDVIQHRLQSQSALGQMLGITLLTIPAGLGGMVFLFVVIGMPFDVIELVVTSFFGTTFTALGITAIILARRKRKWNTRALTQGTPTFGTVLEIHESVNRNRIKTVFVSYNYEWEGTNHKGVGQFEGQHSLGTGSSVAIMVVPEAPKRSFMLPPDLRQLQSTESRISF